jgi:hypothetical protein
MLGRKGANMETVTLTLTVNEVNALLGVLGELPTKTGVFPIAVKVKQQAEEQLKPKDGEP